MKSLEGSSPVFFSNFPPLSWCLPAAGRGEDWGEGGDQEDVVEMRRFSPHFIYTLRFSWKADCSSFHYFTHNGWNREFH